MGKRKQQQPPLGQQPPSRRPGAGVHPPGRAPLVPDLVRRQAGGNDQGTHQHSSGQATTQAPTQATAQATAQAFLRNQGLGRGQGTTPPAPGVSRTAPQAPGGSRTAPQAPGVSRTAPQAPGVPRNAPQAPGVSRTAPQAPGASRTAPQAPGVSRTAPQAPGVPINAPQAPGVLRNAPQAPGVSRTAPQAPGASRTAPQAPGVPRTAPQAPGVSRIAPQAPGVSRTFPHVRAGGSRTQSGAPQVSGVNDQSSVNVRSSPKKQTKASGKGGKGKVSKSSNSRPGIDGSRLQPAQTSSHPVQSSSQPVPSSSVPNTAVSSTSRQDNDRGQSSSQTTTRTISEPSQTTTSHNAGSHGNHTCSPAGGNHGGPVSAAALPSSLRPISRSGRATGTDGTDPVSSLSQQTTSTPSAVQQRVQQLQALSTPMSGDPNNTTDHADHHPNSLNVDVLNGPEGGVVNHQPQSILTTSDLDPGVTVQGRPEVNGALPDILNSHVLPPYTARPNRSRSSRHNTNRGENGAASGGRAQSSHRWTRSPVQGSTQLEDDGKGCCSKDCCVGCLTVISTFRWVLVTLAMLGVCCVITGIILGALHMTVGSSFLTLSLMFIGLGVMLVVVVGVGWKCTPVGHEPCHLLFNLGEHSIPEAVATMSTIRPHRGRNQWYGGVAYPEFRFRRPPPSYNASMQEYQQQLMIAQMQLNNGGGDAEPGDDSYSLPSSPPPTYKSRASTIRPPVHITFPPNQGGDYPSSRPPTYRSHSGGRRPSLPDMDGVNDAIDIEISNDTSDRSRVSPHSSPGSASSTMRANRVVEYLEGVIDSADLPPDGTEPHYSHSEHQRPNTPSETLENDSERIADTPL